MILPPRGRGNSLFSHGTAKIETAGTDPNSNEV